MKLALLLVAALLCACDADACRSNADCDPGWYCAADTLTCATVLRTWPTDAGSDASDSPPSDAWEAIATDSGAPASDSTVASDAVAMASDASSDAAPPGSDAADPPPPAACDTAI